MPKPTNKLFTHGIQPELNIQDLRISLTFCHLLSSPIPRPMKKPKLQVEDSQPINCTVRDSSTEKDIPSTNSVCEKNSDF